MIPAPAVRGGGFKACCLTSGRYDGAERKDYFQVRRDPRSGRIGPVDQSERRTTGATAKGRRAPAYSALFQIGAVLVTSAAILSIAKRSCSGVTSRLSIAMPITSWFLDVSQNITGCVVALLCSA